MEKNASVNKIAKTIFKTREMRGSSPAKRYIILQQLKRDYVVTRLDSYVSGIKQKVLEQS